MSISKFFNKYKMVIKYFICSIFSSIIDVALLYILKNVFDDIVIANTISILFSSIFHYCVTTKFVFDVKYNAYSIIIYIVTFFIGLGIQDFVIWLSYNHLLVKCISNERLLTLISKGLSLGASFFITYGLRKVLNMLVKKGTENEEK